MMLIDVEDMGNVSRIAVVFGCVVADSSDCQNPCLGFVARFLSRRFWGVFRVVG